MSMQVRALSSRVVVRPTVRVKIKRRLREAVRLIVTRGAAVEKSRKGLEIIFRAEDIGADKWIAPGVLLFVIVSRAPTFLSFFSVPLLLTMGLSHRLDVRCFAHNRNVPHAVCGIDRFNASSARVSSSMHSRS
jgi:hypothetical protein